MIGNFFKKKEQKPLWSVPEIVADPEDDAQPDPTVKEDPKMTANAHYTVGVNEHGRVQFRMQLDYGSATLTMNDQGTLDLIEDLAHCIRKRYKIEITPIGDAEE